jgi:hypothetical protein
MCSEISQDLPMPMSSHSEIHKCPCLFVMFLALQLVHCITVLNKVINRTPTFRIGWALQLGCKTCFQDEVYGIAVYWRYPSLAWEKDLPVSKLHSRETKLFKVQPSETLVPLCETPKFSESATFPGSALQCLNLPKPGSVCCRGAVLWEMGGAKRLTYFFSSSTTFLSSSFFLLHFSFPPTFLIPSFFFFFW